MRRGLTFIEVVVAVMAVAVIAALVAVALNLGRRKPSNLMLDGTNLSSLSKALMVYGDTNKGRLPGLTATGDYISKPFQGKRYGAMPNAGNEAEEKSGAGCTVATGTNLALALLLDEDGVSPKQLISTRETGETSSVPVDIQEIQRNTVAGSVAHPTGIGVAPLGEVRSNHFSSAMLAYGRPGLKEAWKYDANPHVCLLANRLIFGGAPGRFSSLETASGRGRYEGSVVRADTSVGREKFQFGDLAAGGPFKQLKYGAVTFDAQTETASVVGIFGRSNDMDNFDATPATGVLGSAND